MTINDSSEVKKGHIITTIISIENEPNDSRLNDVDLAYEYALKLDSAISHQVDDKALVRKIDWMILPIICALMSCQLMDKTTNSYAAIMGLKQDLNMEEGQVYSWVGSSFYFGFLIFQYPANILLQMLPLSKTLSVAIFCWGTILMCHAACQSSAPFLLCRVLLGAFEGFMNPAYILLTSQWYKKSEQFMRSCIWFGFQGFGTILGAGIAFGLASNSSYAISSWRLLYVITGALTIFLSIIAFFHIPDLPVQAWFLSESEKSLCIKRIRANQQGFGSKKWKKYQVIEAFKDLRTYLFMAYGMSYAIPNGGFTNFGSILLNDDFGFSTDNALLMNMPGGAIDIIFPITCAYIGRYVIKSRLLICLIINTISLIGICCLAFSSPKGSRLFGYLSFYLATVVVSGMISCISSNTAGYTKKTTVNAVFFIAYCTGNIIGPQTFRTDQAPNYNGAKIAMVVSFIAAEISIALMYFLNVRDNMLRDQMSERVLEVEKSNNDEFADLTDKENFKFRYSI